ncbi:MAG: GDSL-like Lipase/Acylhydrolase [Chthonomonadaceae bacterium]|nr:GDSL-like Lipase/Acylhydrolase [Chthonomonadaceae bacterium]
MHYISPIFIFVLLGIPILTHAGHDNGKAAETARPFWKSATMNGESVLFVKTEEGKPVTARLLFTPAKILTVQSSSGMITYQPGKDYIIRPGSRTLTLPEGSSIPVATEKQLTPPLGTQPFSLRRRDGKGDILFAPAHEYADMQVVVTYEHKKSEWKLPPPRFAAHELPLTLHKLKSGQPVNITFFGDSITVGGNASKLSNVPPFMPPYPDLLIQSLKRVYKSDITYKNLSVGGMTAAWGVQNIAQVAAEKPDLVVLAWGMNDSSGGRPTHDFLADIQGQMDAVRKMQPHAEFILVSSMLPNAECNWAKPQLILEYRDALEKLAGRGIAVADLSSVWEEMLKSKTYLDFTGNGVNHPNDFGHRLYAQTIAALLVK